MIDGLLAAVGASSSVTLGGMVLVVFLAAGVGIGWLMYWSLHHHHQDYDDNDWEG